MRHKGKTRHSKGHQEKRGKIPISHTIHERPESANQRLEIEHWEADTVAGKSGSSCLVTLTDRKSRYLLAGKIDKKLATSKNKKKHHETGTLVIEKTSKTRKVS